MCDRIEAEDPGVFDRIDDHLSSFGPLGQWGLRSTIAGRRSVLLLYGAAVGQLADVLDTGEPLRDAVLRADDAAALPETITTRADAPFGAEYHLGNTALGLAVLYSMLGQIGDAERFFDLAYRAFQADGNPFIAVVSKWNELVALALPWQSEQIDRRRHLQSLLFDSANQAHDMGPATASPIVPDFAVPLIEGDWPAVIEIATVVGQTHSIGMARTIAHSALATIGRHQGKADAAMALVTEMLPDGPNTEPGNDEFVSCQALQRIAANIALDRDGLETAQAWLEAHDRWLEWSGAVLGRADGDLAWAHFHRRAGDQTVARQRAERALARATDPRQALALIAIHRFLGELDTSQRRFTAADEHLQQSLTLAEACLARFERALSLIALAELRAEQQRPDDVQELLVEVRSICQPLGATPTLERADAVESALSDVSPAKPSYPAGLTAREVEVLRLIAQGLTDAEAADLLFVSRRTVSQHLRHIYNKLGVSSRAAATRFAAEHHLV